MKTKTCVTERDYTDVDGTICWFRVRSSSGMCWRRQLGFGFEIQSGQYVWRSIRARLRNNCWRRKATVTTYSECVSIALGIQHAIRVRRIIFCGPSASSLFFSQYLINGATFGEKLMKLKCVIFFLHKSAWKISHSKKNWARYNNNNNNNNIYLTAIGLSPGGSGFEHIYRYLTLCY